MGVTVWLDPVGSETRDYPELGLHAVRASLSGADGWQVPVVTAEEFRRFIAAWKRNDPNGEWNPGGIVEGDGALVYALYPEFPDEDRWVWPVVGVEDGCPVYRLTDWTFTL